MAPIIILLERSLASTRSQLVRRNRHTSKECKAKEAREHFLNNHNERRNTAIEEVENYIEETNPDYKSDDESVDEVGFIATEGIVEKETAFACAINDVNFPSLTDNGIFGVSGSSCHTRSTRQGRVSSWLILRKLRGQRKLFCPVKYFKDAKENLLLLTAEISGNARLSSTLKDGIQLDWPWIAEWAYIRWHFCCGCPISKPRQ